MTLRFLNRKLRLVTVLIILVFSLKLTLIESLHIFNSSIEGNGTGQNYSPDLSELDYSLYKIFFPEVGAKNVIFDSNHNQTIVRDTRQVPGILLGPNGPQGLVPLGPRRDMTQIVLPYVKQKEGFIQGTGSFQCVLQGSFTGRQFVQSVGYYRCIFRGARKTRGFIEGVGYYQLIFQKIGQLQEFIQGVGIYQCNFQSVRHFHGFVNSMGQPIVQTRFGAAIVRDPGVAARTAYLDFMGQYYSDMGEDPAIPYRDPGRIQLLANYQYDIDGLNQHPNFGSVQGIEFLNLDTSFLNLGLTDSKKYGQVDFVSQQGEIQYSLQDNLVRLGGLADLVGALAYNFQYNVSADESFFVWIGRYDYVNDGPGILITPDTDDNHDFVQAVGSYGFDFPRGSADSEQSHIHAIATFQLDYIRRVPDFVQLVAQYDQTFPGLDTDLIEVQLIGTYRKHFPGGRSNEFLQFVGIVSYKLDGEGADTGYFQLYGFYDYMPYALQFSNGYLQYLCQYSFLYQGQGANMFDLQLQLQYQYNFPADSPYVLPSHGYCQVLGKWKIDLHLLGLESRPSFLQFVLIYECNFKGDLNFSDKMCFVQIYSMYQTTVDGVKPKSNAYAQLLGQYYSDM